MIEFMFNSALKKGNYSKLINKKLSDDQIKRVIDSKDGNIREKLALLDNLTLNKEVQQYLLNNIDIDINLKINILLKNDDNIFKDMDDQTLDSIINRDDINFTTIIVLIDMTKKYEKLKLLDNKERIVENEVPGLGSALGFNGVKRVELDTFQKTIISILNIPEQKIDIETKNLILGHAKLRTFDISSSLFEKHGNNMVYDDILSIPTLKSFLYDSMISPNFNNPIIDNSKISLFKGDKKYEDLSPELQEFLKKIILSNEGQSTIYDEKNFNFDRMMSRAVFDYLPHNKRDLLGLYTFFYCFDQERYEKEYNYLKDAYKKNYSELNDEEIDFIVKAQMNEVLNGRVSQLTIKKVLDNHEKDSLYIKKIMLFIKNIDIWLESTIVEKDRVYTDRMATIPLNLITDLENNYPGVLDFVSLMSSVSDEMKEKVKFLLKSPKLQGINSITDIVETSLEEIKSRPLDLEGNKAVNKRNLYVEGSYVEVPFVDGGYHGVMAISSDGDVRRSFGPYHDACFNGLYMEETKDILNIGDNVTFGLNKGDIIVMVEGDSVNVICNKMLSQEQTAELIQMVNESKNRGKFIFQMNVRVDDDNWVAIQNGDKFDPDTLLDYLSKMQVQEKQQAEFSKN